METRHSNADADNEPSKSLRPFRDSSKPLSPSVDDGTGDERRQTGPLEHKQ